MLEKYLPNFLSLSPEEAGYVASAVCHRHSYDQTTEVRSGQDLYDGLVACGLGQADVVMSMASDPSPMAVVCLERIVGRPIIREVPKAQVSARSSAPAAPRAPRERVQKADPRVVTAVVDNPKKPGSKSHERFALYRVGMTVSEFLAAGGTTGDVSYDVARGFITLGDA